MNFKFDEPVKNCKTCGYCNNSVCKLGDDDPNRFCIEYHRWKPKEPEKVKTCGNCDIGVCNAPMECLENYYYFWKPKQKESKMKVTAEAYKLLKESIDVWQKYLRAVVHVFGNVNTVYRVTCPLCIKYNRHNEEDECEGCPICIKTGKVNCSGTPFWNANKGKGGKVTGETIVNIEDEVAFLQSLFDECVVEEEKTYSYGDYFSRDIYICVLAQVGPSECCLISLNGHSNRQNDLIKVENINKITECEFEKMGGKGYTPVTLKITKVENK